MAVGDLFGGGGAAGAWNPGPLQEAVIPPQQMPVANIEENKGLWKQFLDKVSDPNFRQAAFTTGLNFLRTPQIGQSGWDVGANALGAGFNTLGALRERDRIKAIEEQNRAIAEQQRVTENLQKERQLGTSERTAQTYADVSTAQTEQGRVTGERQERELTQAGGIAKEAAISDRIRANAAMIAAQRPVGGKTAADIQKIDALAAYYTGKGMSETDAKAKAVFEVEQGPKRTSLGKQRAFYKGQLLKAWGADVTNLGKPIPRAEIERVAGEMAQADIDAELAESDAPAMPVPGATTPQYAPPGAPPVPPIVAPNAAPGAAAPPVAPPAAAAPAPPVPTAPPVSAAPPGAPVSPMAAIQQAGANAPAVARASRVATPQGPPQADPAVAQKIAVAKTNGYTPELIRAALMKDGINPALYGF